jgi:preprotein translocase subunit SecA
VSLAANSPFQRVVGPAASWRRRRLAAAIARQTKALCQCDAADLLDKSNELWRRAWLQEPLIRLLPSAFALVSESIQRTTGLTLHREQLWGGIALFVGGIAEMQTGEGKTVTALLPAFLHALAGHGCHVVTVNDYLAQRDAALAASVLEPLGLRVGWVSPALDTDARRIEYAKDITYGTAREIGFDFLRDRIRQAGRPNAPTSGGGTETPVQRRLHFALADEADNVLIDDAGTPLVIALKQAGDDADAELFRWSLRTAAELSDKTDFVLESHGRSAHLTDAGCLRLIRVHKPHPLEGLDLERLYRQVEHSLAAQHGFRLDHQYVVADGKLAIVDESTGRVLDGRKWHEGLHQAIEAKERLPITAATQTAAKITVQSFFRLYTHRAGMTGTAVSARRDFRSDYALGVVRIPTHRRCRRIQLSPRIFVTAAAKRQALADDVERWLEQERAVLLGTPSVAASEELALALLDQGIACDVLNCRAHQREAEIISQAGQPGRVTIATNMAGRGTDIKVHADVLRSGGLHVVATEMHASGRIDLQLFGRTARQGEPGSCQFYLSLEDELLASLDDRHREPLRHRAQRAADRNGELPQGWLRVFQDVQASLESRNRGQRRELMQHERRRREAFKKTGLDPWLDVID